MAQCSDEVIFFLHQEFINVIGCLFLDEIVQTFGMRDCFAFAVEDHNGSSIIVLRFDECLECFEIEIPLHHADRFALGIADGRFEYDDNFAGRHAYNGVRNESSAHHRLVEVFSLAQIDEGRIIGAN